MPGLGHCQAHTDLSTPVHFTRFNLQTLPQPRLDEYSAALADGAPVVCLFVNDDCNAKVGWVVCVLSNTALRQLC